MNDQALEDALTRMSHFSVPPSDVIRDVLDAYKARVAELETAITKQTERVAAEVRFQHSIREQERDNRAEQYERHQREKRLLVQELGFAAKVHQRVLDAQWRGRKTVKVESLLEGRPEDEQ